MAGAPDGETAGPATKQVAEAADQTEWRRIHNCDQRSPYVTLDHPALGKKLMLEQRGSSDPGFVQGTSSVAWPAAVNCIRILCEKPEVLKGRQVVELGSGIGLVGAAAAALGAERVVLTDCEGAIPLLERNRARLAEEGVSNVEVHRIDWGEDAHHKEILVGPTQQGFDVVLVCDCIVAGFDTERLAQSCLALLSKAPDAKLLVAFEYREDWDVIGSFIHTMNEAGLDDSYIPLCAEDADEDDDDIDQFMYTFTWK